MCGTFKYVYIFYHLVSNSVRFACVGVVVELAQSPEDDLRSARAVRGRRTI